MLLNINNRVANPLFLPKTEIGKHSDAKIKPQSSSSNALQAQLNFMGVAMRPLVKAVNPVLSKYLREMQQVRFQDATILHSGEKGLNVSRIILLDTSLSFPDAIASLSQNIKAFKTSGIYGVELGLKIYSFNELKEAVSACNGLKDMAIKGIIGQGDSATAFLTESNEVIKLSLNRPIFPTPETFIEGVELPILSRYFMPVPEQADIIYGMMEPLAENSSLRDISRDKYNEIWNGFDAILQENHPSFAFNNDFSPNDYGDRRQIGFIGDIPYLLDHQVIVGRELQKHP